MPPFFGHHERAVYVTLREVYLSALFEIFGQSFEYAAKNSFLNPLLKAPMAGLVGGIAFGQVLLRCPGTKYPEYWRLGRRVGLARACLVGLLFEVGLV